jgi:hypothetical protein
MNEKNTNLQTILEQVKNMSKNQLKIQEESIIKRDTISTDDIEKIMEEFAKYQKCDKPLAFIGAMILMQKGGTNTSIENLQINVESTIFDLTLLRLSVKKYSKTVRQLAKSLRNEIAEFSKNQKIQGPLAKALVREYPNETFTDEDLIYAAEYHEDNNDPNMPLNIRKCLADRSQKLKIEQKKNITVTNKKKPNKRKR